MKRLVCLLTLLALGALTSGASPAGAYYSGSPRAGDPLAGQKWYVDKLRSSWWITLRTDASAGVLGAAADNPMGKTIGTFVSDPETVTRDYIARAESEEPGSMVFLNIRRLEGTSCPFHTGPSFAEPLVDRFVEGVSRGIGDAHAYVIIETDQLTTLKCLPHWAQLRRLREIAYEVTTLRRNNPNAYTYIDAGSANWGKNAATIAGWLRRANVADANGFELGSSHHDWTYKEVQFGLAISKRLGGKHFTVNTNENGWGPNAHDATSPFYHPGCAPPGEGLGIEPTVNTPNRVIDAFVWAGTPGFEVGQCLGYGANSPYTFYPSLAISLAENENPPADDQPKPSF